MNANEREYQIVESRAENIFLLLRFNPLAHPPRCRPHPPLYDEDRKLLRSNSQVEQASACFARVILAPGALSPAHRLTGPLGQISRTEAVEVDFGQSLEGKKVTSRVSARPFPTSPRFRSPQGGARPAPSGDDNSQCRSVPPPKIPPKVFFASLRLCETWVYTRMQNQSQFCGLLSRQRKGENG